MSLTVAVIQQSEGTPPGSVMDWIRLRGHRADLRRLFAGDAVPALELFELAVVLGGPMNVDDVELHPWLAEEKLWLRRLIDASKPCLGICLGGQLLAQTLGAEVRQHLHWEVGWHPVTFDDGRSLTVFQWHHDTFGVPAGARLLAGNSITAHQGFCYGEHIVGLQFHPEATAEWVRECSEETPYPHGPYVQAPVQLLAGVGHIPAMRAWMFDVLDRLAAAKRV